MTEHYKLLENKDRKKILLLADDIRTTSGIATIAREIVIGTSHHFKWTTVGAAINHPEQGKKLDLSEDTNKQAGISDSEVTIYPFNGYGNPDLLRYLINTEKPDVLMFFTDPRYYIWLFDVEQEFRQKVPFIYLNIWDAWPAPIYNKNYYRSCDTLMAISKQTKILNEIVLNEYKDDKIIKYVPHGINEKHFYPIVDGDEKWNQVLDMKKTLFGNREYKFVLFFNSRNIRRKSIPDTLMAFKLFLDKLPEDKRKECAFVLHTQRVDENGTDLNAVVDVLFEDSSNIIFSDLRIPVENMNLLYNCIDCGILLSSNEGWGLSVTEALMCGKPVIANVQGGMQDQARFEDKEGNWIEFNDKFTSNSVRKYQKCGEWFIPVFPNNHSIQGSVPTPYIVDERIDFRDAAEAIAHAYSIGSVERKRIGLLGRKWVTSDESMMSAGNMCKNIIYAVDETLETWKPRSRYDIVKSECIKKKHLKNSMPI